MIEEDQRRYLCPEPQCSRELRLLPDRRWPFHYTGPGIGRVCPGSGAVAIKPVPCSVDPYVAPYYHQ